MAMGRALVRSLYLVHHHRRLCCLPYTSITLHFRRLLSVRTSPGIEWSEAQKITLSADLETSARQLLKFLAEIDKNHTLYEGPVLDRAIYRYKNYWLPLLAKNSEPAGLGCPLVVPLDCEWIWHIHRLNPKRYKTDCEELYGRILDHSNVESTTQRTSLNQMNEIWTRMFLDEPFEVDLSNPMTESDAVSKSDSQKSTDYDLVSAVKRQSTFFYQVSRPHVSNNIFLKEAIARYKGFLHLIKKNKEMSIKRFCVPTYDIDLIWHAHQLHSALYCKDTTAICGEVLDHDDTDTDRSEGMKLSVEFMETSKRWEELYGLRYWKAGAMYRGSAPSPLTVDAHIFEKTQKSEILANKSQNIIQLPKKMLIEVLLEIVEVRGLPQRHGDKLFIKFSQRNKNNLHYITEKNLSISTESQKKQVINFQSEPTSELLFELMSKSSTTNYLNSAKIIGTTTISLVDVVNAGQQLSVDRWFELLPPLESKDTNPPISLRISLSFTPPASAPYMLHMVPSGGVKSHTLVLDKAGNPVIGVYMRCVDKSPYEVIGVLESREDSILAKKEGAGWSLMDSQWDFRPRNKPENSYELLGETKVIFFPGKKLDYETKHSSQKDEHDNFTTAVEFSPENPYGKAVALLDLKFGVLQTVCQVGQGGLVPATRNYICLLYPI
ncbi:glycine-rich domain-containing protein 2-like isoform X2 [Chenopodium quinoa]|uniref:glycine-rich domain-containing protein 2-like isoform X2 n=1 Tax=Chenopodium quinoa TaxID=63459 RepID=UPI000B77FA42|nr:glycine-rich domain-containing protein 2-like isoform X2 [Chenopodium quinoa]